MPAGHHLTAVEREWFALLTETVFANPFGSDPARMHRLLEGPSPATVSQATAYGALLPALERRLATLAARGLTRLDQFHGADRTRMVPVVLFRIYQMHLPRFDALIEQPTAASSNALRAPFEMLLAAGVEPPKAARWIALYWQMRRAYFFIDQALIGRSEPMRRLRQALWNSVFTNDLRIYALLLWERMQDFATLLLGETGTGKGSAAAAIGRSGPIPFDPASGRFAHGIEPGFVATNLAELSPGLIESELFGHRKGAFTGAIGHHDGLFARCGAGGTLFLDEIGDIPLPIQTKLLRVLQERSFRPVGSHEERRFAGRVVAATNRPLADLLGGNGFRADLFYRLAANVIEVPTLRERIADSPGELAELVDALLGRLAGAAAPQLRERVLAALARLPPDYPWPGNVRELEQAVRRILLNGAYRPDRLSAAAGVGAGRRGGVGGAQGGVAGADAGSEAGGAADAGAGFGAAAEASARTDAWLGAVAAGQLDAADLVAGYCRRLYARLGSFAAVARVTGLDRRTVRRHCR